MEFLRFGSSIPGGYWGCCAVCIIQNFSYADPKAKASIQLVSGDGGNPIINSNNESLFAGPTYEDIFKTRLRIGTFSKSDMPNHVFLAVMTDDQIQSGIGKKWLEILKREGFEFIRSTDNSVYTGPDLASKTGGCSSHVNHIFGLFRNIGNGRIKDPFQPPKVWTDLDDPYGGDMSPQNMWDTQVKMWETLGKPKFLTEQEVRDAGAVVTLAGQRLEGAAPESKEARDERKKAKDKASKSKGGQVQSAAGDPFAIPV